MATGELATKQAAKFMSVHPSTLYEMRKDGRLTGTQKEGRDGVRRVYYKKSVLAKAKKMM